MKITLKANLSQKTLGGVNYLPPRSEQLLIIPQTVLCISGQPTEEVTETEEQEW